MIEFSFETIYQVGLTTNLTALFLLGVIVFHSLRTISIKNKNNRFIYWLFGMSLLEVSTHLITILLEKEWFFECNQLGVFMYSFVFTVNCFYLISWIIYLNFKLRNMYASKQTYLKRTVILSIPVMVLLLLSIINMFTPVFFSFIDFEYERKSLYELNTIMPILYLLYGLVLFFKSNKKKKIYMELPFCELLFPIVVSHLIEYVFVDLCVIPLGNVITLILLVFSNIIRDSSVDGLTGLYTRKELFDYLEANEDSQEQEKKQIMGIMLDLDHFKAINDTYGHLAGDDALVDFGYIIRASLPSNAIGYRYAGDEFVVITKCADEKQLDDIVESIYNNLSEFNKTEKRKYKLASSYGISVYEKNDTINDFVERMDQRMYENKMSKRS